MSAEQDPEPPGGAPPPTARSSESSPGAATPPTPLRWWETARTKLLGGAGVVVTGVLVAVLSDSIGRRVDPPPAPLPTTSEAPSASATVANPTTSLASTTPPRTTATPDPARKPYTGSPGAGWSVGGEATRITGDLLTVTASMDPSDECSGATGWVFSQPPQDLAPLPAAGDPDAWAVRNGGTPASGNYIVVDVQARPGHPVIIDSLGYRVVRRRTPVAGSSSWPQLSGGCGGLVPAFFAADVGKGRPLRAVDGEDETGAPVPSVPMPHRLNDADPSEQWRIRLDTTSCSCDVVPFLRYTADGQTATVEITNRGGAWRVAPTRGSRLVTRADEGGSWSSYGTAP